MKRQQEDKRLLLQIQSIKLKQPFWGYRRIWRSLKYRRNLVINRKANKNKPRLNRPSQFWGIDLIKVVISPFGWLSLVISLDWFTKKIIGYSISRHSRTEDWLDALNNAGNNQFPNGILSKPEDLYLSSDNGFQATLKRYLEIS